MRLYNMFVFQDIVVYPGVRSVYSRVLAHLLSCQIRITFLVSLKGFCCQRDISKPEDITFLGFPSHDLYYSYCSALACMEHNASHWNREGKF